MVYSLIYSRSNIFNLLCAKSSIITQCGFIVLQLFQHYFVHFFCIFHGRFIERVIFFMQSFYPKWFYQEYVFFGKIDFQIIANEKKWRHILRQNKMQRTTTKFHYCCLCNSKNSEREGWFQLIWESTPKIPVEIVLKQNWRLGRICHLQSGAILLFKSMTFFWDHNHLFLNLAVYSICKRFLITCLFCLIPPSSIFWTS